MRENMVKDPVCGMSVDEKKSTLKAEHKGQTYHFCCGGCQTKFKAEPDKHVRAAKK